MLIWVVSSIYLGVNFDRIPPEIPLFYSLVRGEQQLASREFILVLPVVSILFIIAHLLIAHLAIADDKVVSRVLALSTVMVTFLFAVAWIHVVYIVI